MTKRRKGLGINKLEYALMLPGIHKQLRKSIDDGILDVGQALIGTAWLTKRFERAASKEYKPIFGSLTRTLESVAIIINKEDKMATKFELGITVGEITAMLPAILAEAWEHYSDDKNISVAEGLEIVSVILNEMEKAADDVEVQELLASVASVVLAVGPFVEEEEEEPVE